MSEWTARIRDHRIWDLVKNLGPIIDKAEQVAGSLDSAKTEVEAFLKDSNSAHLINANNSADAAMVQLSQVSGVTTPEELIGLLQAVNSHREMHSYK